MKFERVKFTKKQCAVLHQMFLNANKTFTENVMIKPQIYEESERYIYVYGYVKSFIEFLFENEYVYLEE